MTSLLIVDLNLFLSIIAMILIVPVKKGQYTHKLPYYLKEMQNYSRLLVADQNDMRRTMAIQCIFQQLWIVKLLKLKKSADINRFSSVSGNFLSMFEKF